MQDYFGEFLLKTPLNVSPNLGGFASDSGTNLKTHLVWALLAGSGIFVSWKASEIYTQYRLTAENLRIKKKKKSKKAKKAA